MPTRPRAFIAVALLAVLSSAAWADEYTVDGFTGGYTAPPVGASVAIGPGQDDVTASVTLPFEFPYFGGLHTQARVCSNGWMAFGTTTATVSANPLLPSTAEPNNVVAPLWDDLATGTGNVVTFTEGVAPNRTFVVSWEGVDTFSGASQSVMSFQVRLDETTGVVEIAYASGGTWNGLSFTAGIEDSGGEVAFGGPNTDNQNAGQPTEDQRFTPRSVTFDGSILRDRPVAATTGLGATTETDLPVAFAEVAVIREDTGATIAHGLTDAAGDFSVSALGVDDPLTLAVDLRAAGPGSRVVTAGNVVYSFRLGSNLGAGVDHDLGVTTLDDIVDGTDGNIRKALNIQQAIERGRIWADDAAALSATNANPQTTPETFPRVDVEWVSGISQGLGSSYLPSDGTSPARIFIDDFVLDPDPYDDDVILRQYGQHVFATISVHSGPTGASFGTGTSGPQAFIDGFAFLFVAAVQNRDTYIDTIDDDEATVIRLEGPDPLPPFAPNVTGAVAASFYDLVDGTNEVHDRFGGTLGLQPNTASEIFQVIDQDLDALGQGVSSFTMRSFFAAWRVDGDTIDRINTAVNFIHHGVLPDDAREPNDDFGAESPFPDGVQKLTGLSLTPFNEDRFSFDYDGADAVLTVTVLTGQPDTEFELELLDDAGAVLAAGGNVGAATTQVVRVSSPGPLAAGTYAVRVNWRGTDPAVTGTYSLTFGAPLEIVTQLLPEWTQGQPFKENLAAGGGVPPYGFTTDQAVPGLATALSGTQLLGTPTAAGTFTIDVTVQDDDAPQGSVQTEIPLVVNPPLTLRTLFGVAESRVADGLLGSGGTAAAWVPGMLPGGALTLVSNGELRLEGAAGAPRTFEISASATDSVGASLPEQNSRVVVASPLVAPGSTTVAAGSHVGLYFDAMAGSSVTFDLRYSGTGSSPRILDVLDAAGNSLLPSQRDANNPSVPTSGGKIIEKGRRTQIKKLLVTASGRYFVISRYITTPSLTGTYSAKTKIKSVTRSRGEIAVSDPAGFVEVSFEAIGGSVLSATVRRGAAPSSILPQIFAVIGPDDGELPIASRGRSKRGKKRSIGGVVIPASGTYRLRIGDSDGAASGPVIWRYRLRVPKGAAFAVD